MPRNPRRAYDKDGTEIEPMSLAVMREHGVTSVEATCQVCQHEAIVEVPALPAETPVPDIALAMRLKCSKCGAKAERIYVRPSWRGFKAAGMGRSSAPK